MGVMSRPTYETWKVEDYPVGSKVRRCAQLSPTYKAGPLGHVRAHVDGMLVVRVWVWGRWGRKRWEYELLDVYAFTQEHWMSEREWQREGKAEAIAKAAKVKPVYTMRSQWVGTWGDNAGGA